MTLDATTPAGITFRLIRSWWQQIWTPDSSFSKFSRHCLARPQRSRFEASVHSSSLKQVQCNCCFTWLPQTMYSTPSGLFKKPKRWLSIVSSCHEVPMSSPIKAQAQPTSTQPPHHQPALHHHSNTEIFSHQGVCCCCAIWLQSHNKKKRKGKVT